MEITSTSSSLHRSKSFCSRCALKENCISQRHFLALGFMFSTRCSLTKPCSCNFMLTRQVLFTKVIHVLSQVQNKTAFIHYFYKAIMNDSLACDLFHKNYEPFTSLLVTWERLSFWYVVVFLGRLAARVNDLVFVLIECLWALPSLCCVSDDSGNRSGSAPVRSASDLPECRA